MARRLLGVFAHPDDEVFCAGGTFARHAAAGDEVMVVSATRGEAGQIRDAASATRATLGVARERELRAACELLGVQRVRCLDHVDGTLADLDRGAFVDEIAAVIDDFLPDVVVTFGADGLYGHPDHVAISEATTDACALRPHLRLFHSSFPRSRLLLVDSIAEWLVELRERFSAPADFARVFSLFATETTAVGFADDHLEVAWFPPGVAIIEQDEASHRLYLILSGEVEVAQDDGDGRHIPLRRQGPGEFFGELGVAASAPRTASVISTEPVTCLVFSRRAATGWDGRGSTTAGSAVGGGSVSSDPARPAGTTVIDVRPVLDRKVAALAAHRSQYPIEPDMFPRWLLEGMMGHEWFVRVQPAVEPANDLFEG